MSYQRKPPFCSALQKKNGHVCGRPVRTPYLVARGKANPRLCGTHADSTRSERAKQQWASKRCPFCGGSGRAEDIRGNGVIDLNGVPLPPHLRRAAGRLP